MNADKVIKWQLEAHAAPINTLLPLSEALLASGDDDGCIKIWDGRQKAAAAEFSHHTDYVSAFTHQVRKLCVLLNLLNVPYSLSLASSHSPLVLVMQCQNESTAYLSVQHV